MESMQYPPNGIKVATPLTLTAELIGLYTLDGFNNSYNFDDNCQWDICGSSYYAQDIWIVDSKFTVVSTVMSTHVILGF